jgi:phosphoribosylaminoimidazole-succinocarboxamide synthase
MRGPRVKPRTTPARPSREAAEEDIAMLTPITVPAEWLEPAHAVAEVSVPGATPWRRGKVRSIYEAGPDHLVIVASDRLSAYDSILPTPIPGKGAILSRISAFWMRSLPSARPHHLVSDDPATFPAPFAAAARELEGRAQLVRRAERVDIECVVRGHLTGSGWKEYRRGGAVCGLPLPRGLGDGSRLEPAIFTPATKSDSGHDENISFERMVEIAGRETAEALRARSLAIYEEARAHAWTRGLVLADTKFEFGRIDGELALIDEALTPDSSRYWDRAAYEAGRLESFDKQVVRDWLDRSGWDHEPPAPALPPEVVRSTQERYLECITRLSGPERT